MARGEKINPSTPDPSWAAEWTRVTAVLRGEKPKAVPKKKAKKGKQKIWTDTCS
jgi:hypothetical protein